jgi:tetratricopeptide (TPR) repeat protein
MSSNNNNNDTTNNNEHPRTIETLKLQGNTAFSDNDMIKASMLYTKALQLCSEQDWDMKRILHSNRSAARLKVGDVQGALMDAEEALRLAPGWSKAFIRKANALETLGRYQEAKRSFEAALAGEPENLTLKENIQRIEQFILNPSLAPPPSSVTTTTTTTTTSSTNTTTRPQISSIDDLFAEVEKIQSEANCVSVFSKITNIDHDKETNGWTKENQLDRLLQKHYKFLNLNPYHVFGFQSYEANNEDIKKRFHKLSSLVHPDKNPDYSQRAREAFEIVTHAHEELINVDRRNLYLEIFDQAKQQVETFRAMKLKEYGGNEQRLELEFGPLKDAIDEQIKKILDTNEQERIRTLKYRQANEERAAKIQLEKSKETNHEWQELKRKNDESKQGQDERRNDWQEFRKKTKFGN